MSQPDNAQDGVARADRAPERGRMTVISPLRSVLTTRPWPGGWLLVSLLFAYTNLRNRAGRPSLEPAKERRDIAGKVRALRFIHSSHFGLIRHFPRQGQPADDVRKCLLLFVSDYDGDAADYIDGFSALIPFGMKLFWGTSYGFPGPLPVTPFQAYVAANEFPADHAYTAHRGATARTIVAALAFRDRHDRFQERADSLDPEGFEVEYRKLVFEAQERL